MIRLANSGSGAEIFESATLTNPQNNGGTSFTVVHNTGLGTPDLIRMFEYNTDIARWQPSISRMFESNRYGYDYGGGPGNTLNLNQVNVRAFLTTYNSIKFKVYWFNN